MTTVQLLMRSSFARTLVAILGMIIAFNLMPFMVHGLGDKWYGIWAIISGIVGYYYLMDFGLASAVTRYVTLYTAKNDYRSANVIINTSFVIYSALAAVLVIVTMLIAVCAGQFASRPEDVPVIRGVVVLMGLSLALEFPFKACSGIIGAHLRYDLLSYSHAVILLANAGATVFFLKKGYGILALAVVCFVGAQLSNIIYFLISRYLFKELAFGRQFVEKDKIRTLWNYSVWTFIVQTADQLRGRVGSVVIGFVFSAELVTHYYIGARFAEYLVHLILKATNIITPIFTKYHATSSYDELRDKIILLTKINAVLAMFGGGLIILLGKAFIWRWVGESYVDAYPVLVFLTIAGICEVVSTPVNNALYAIAKHQILGVTSTVEGLSCLLITIGLVYTMGITGAAIGTVVPMVLNRLIITPYLTCRAISLSPWRYYSSILTVGIFTSVYLGGGYAFAGQWTQQPQYAVLAMTACLAGVPYSLGALYVVFTSSERSLLLKLLPKRMRFTQKAET